VFRLLKAAREGKRQQEEVRIAGSTVHRDAGCGCGFVRSARGKREAKYAVWSIADITRDRERQEDVFRSCSTRSNISTTRHAASSRSVRPATSSMSTPRWRTGSITISPRSVRAG
jgi:hypothetical protein